MKSNKPVVGVFGHYGNHNLGDESIIDASIAQIRKRLPDAEIICMSLRPDDTAKRHHVEAYGIRNTPGSKGPVIPGKEADSQYLPWVQYAQQRAAEDAPSQIEADTGPITGLKERLKALPVLGILVKFAIRLVHMAQDLIEELGFLVRTFKYLKRFDLLVVCGSNQFLDNFGGAWEFPYTLLKWSIMAKLRGVKLAYASVGANPLEQSLSKPMIRAALGMADYISYRDHASKAIIETPKAKFEGHVYPDLAFGLDFTRINRTNDPDKKLVVGINPMPVFDHRYWCEDNSGKYLGYVKKLAHFAELLITHDYQLFFFPTMWRDDDVIIDVMNAMDPELRAKMDKSTTIRDSEEVDGLLSIMQEADIIVATRFHGTVLALLSETPVLGVSYYRKNSDLMNNMGQGDYNENFETLDIDALWNKFLDLEAKRPNQKEKIIVTNKIYRNLIEEQWDNITGLIS